MEVSIHSYKFSMEETARYAMLADEAVARSDVLILNGHNAGLRVVNKALHVKQGRLLGVEREPAVYYKGMVPFNTIVILTKSGLISMESLHWCREQNISLLLLDGLGNIVYSMYPEPESNAKLRRLQYQAVDTGMDGYIAREMVRRKTLSQMKVVEELYGGGSGLRRNLTGAMMKPFEDGLVELSKKRDIESIVQLEGRLASYYWSALTAQTIRWRSKDEKVVPPHWKVVTERMGTMSVGPGARKAKNPFHAALNCMYGVAEHTLLRAIHSVGLDPACGFLHCDKDGRLSLVYDLIEPHRAEIDRAVIDFFSRTELRAGDVTLLPEGHVMLNMELLRYLIVSCLPDGKNFADTVTWLVEVLTRGS